MWLKPEHPLESGLDKEVKWPQYIKRIAFNIIIGEKMRLVRLGVTLEFAEKGRVRSPAEKVFKAIRGGERLGKVRKPTEPGVHVQMVDEKLDIQWRSERCSIGLEHVPSLEYCVERVLSLLNQINTVAPIGMVTSTEVVTNWLLPAPKYDFASLERKYRETMIVAHKDVWEGTYDSSVILDIQIGDYILHHQSGTMAPQQLIEDYLLFEPEKVPEVFLFLGVDITDKKVVKYSQEKMSKQLITLIGHCKAHSDTFGQIWEGVL